MYYICAYKKLTVLNISLNRVLGSTKQNMIIALFWDNRGVVW
jgi:hypothetical protein